ncbi:MAG: histidine kinase [Acidimicrobiia bacterium]|nr:histidine kinase [Acidimicrobiia bacterium]
MLVAVVAGYARRISGEADRQHSLALDRLGRLADANALLFSLHRVTQTLPASLDLDEVLDSTVSRLRGLFDFDSVVVLALDETDTSWEVLRREGVRLPGRIREIELPPPAQRALADRDVVLVGDLQGDEGPGLGGHAGSGMYAVLPARGATIGLLAVESKSTGAFTARDRELCRGFVEPVALAIDNARWFTRLRTVGADEERTRIARDLHDRIGQSLAYLAFELDRIVTRNAEGGGIDAELEQLRSDVRGVIGEVRDTLYDLRTDIQPRSSASPRSSRPSGTSGSEADRRRPSPATASARLPHLQEREMWRIAQEAVANVERHAAGPGSCTWVGAATANRPRSRSATSGTGFPSATAGRMDSYGILGMRERASSIGATLEVHSMRRATAPRSAASCDPTDPARRGSIDSDRHPPSYARPTRPGESR